MIDGIKATFITLTMAPALDVEYRCHTLPGPDGGMTRAYSQSVTAGGKGINVSRAIKRCNTKDESLLITIAALGLRIGTMCENILKNENLPITRIALNEETRVNVSVIPDEGEPIEINAPGTPFGNMLIPFRVNVPSYVWPKEEENLTVFVIAGSIPSDVEPSEPAKLCRTVKEKGAIVAADVDGEVMRQMLEIGHSDYIKPNRDELSRLTGRKIETAADAIDAAQELLNNGSVETAVIVTLAGDGAVYVGWDGAFVIPTVKRKVVRLKGAGDTFLGAFLFARYSDGLSAKEAMQFAADTAGAYVAGE